MAWADTDNPVNEIEINEISREAMQLPREVLRMLSTSSSSSLLLSSLEWSDKQVYEPQILRTRVVAQNRGGMFRGGTYLETRTHSRRPRQGIGQYKNNYFT